MVNEICKKESYRESWPPIVKIKKKKLVYLEDELADECASSLETVAISPPIAFVSAG